MIVTLIILMVNVEKMEKHVCVRNDGEEKIVGMFIYIYIYIYI